MDELRSDAARNRARILDVAREIAAGGEPLALNAVARAAGVGVGTVYRHFATVEELEETLVWERFDDLADTLSGAGPHQFETVLTKHFTLLVDDALFETVTARAVPTLEHTAAMRDSLTVTLQQVLDQTRVEGALRDGINAAEVLMLMCGLAHSVRNVGLDADSPQARMLLRVAFDGMRGDAKSSPAH